MKTLLLLLLFLVPLPANSQMWKEFWRENIEESTGWVEYSNDIDLQSITKIKGYYYVKVRHWSNHPNSKTAADNQSISTIKISCEEQTIQDVGHNWGGISSIGTPYKRFPNGDWKWKMTPDIWRTSSTGNKDLLFKEVCD